MELGNDAKCALEGIGDIQFQLEYGGPLEVKDVLYVPGITKNLLVISVISQLIFYCTLLLCLLFRHSRCARKINKMCMQKVSCQMALKNS